MDANRTSPGYELKDELARLCLATARREPERKLAWVNSVCILFLLIGIFGARQGAIAIKPVPPIREEVPIVVQPTVLPPQAVAPKPEQAQPINQPRVLVALPNAPNVNFGIPTAGTLVVPAALAVRAATGARCESARSTTPAPAANGLNRLILPSPCKPANKARLCCAHRR